MATRRKAKGKGKAKAKGKVKAKRKKRPIGKTARGKTATIRKKAAKKPARRPAASKARRPATTAKPRPTGARASAATKPARPAAPSSSEQRIGVVTHYYSHLSVAAMQLEPGATLRVGDVIHIYGHTTDFTQRVESLEVDHAAVSEVGAKDDFGLKVIDHAREHDVVFKVRS